MKRTLLQNAALHKYFQLRADSLNDAGYTLDDLSGDVTVPASADMVEMYLWNERGEVTKIHRQCFKFIAEVFNDMGIDFRLLMPDHVHGRFDEHLVKECIWRPVQIQTIGKESSANLTVAEVSDVHNRVEMLCNIKFPDAEYVEFPHRERGEIEYPEKDYSLSQIPF